MRHRPYPNLMIAILLEFPMLDVEEIHPIPLSTMMGGSRWSSLVVLPHIHWCCLWWGIAWITVGPLIGPGFVRQGFIATCAYFVSNTSPPQTIPPLYIRIPISLSRLSISLYVSGLVISHRLLCDWTPAISCFHTAHSLSVLDVLLIPLSSTHLRTSAMSIFSPASIPESSGFPLSPPALDIIQSSTDTSIMMTSRLIPIYSVHRSIWPLVYIPTHQVAY